MICKFCSAEVEDGVAVCPVCGKELDTPETEQEVSVGKEEKKSKSKVWVKILAVIGIAALALLLTVGVLLSMGKLGYVLHNMKFWRPNDINYKLSYTVKNTEAEKKKDVVIATVGNQTLTNGELQAHYWSAVYEYINYYYGNYITGSGLDITKPLNEQYYGDTGKTYQQWFLELALENWYQHATLKQMAEDNKYTFGKAHEEYMNAVKDQVEAMRVEYQYTDMEKFIDDQFFPGCSYDLYLKYTELNYIGPTYYYEIFKSMKPTQEQIEAYYKANEADFIKEKIDKSAGNYYDVRHILVGIEGGSNGSDGYGEDQWAACLEAAQAMLDNFLANEPTEEKFAELAKNNSRDPGSKENGGLYPNLTKDYGFIKDFEAWYMDPERQVGDTGLVKNTESSVQGYHIMYFSGSAPIWEREAENGLLGDNADKQIEAAKAKYPLNVNYKKIVLSTVNLMG